MSEQQDPRAEFALPPFVGDLAPGIIGELLGAIPRGGRRKFVKGMLRLRAQELTIIGDVLAQEQPVLAAWVKSHATALVAYGEILQESEDE